MRAEKKKNVSDKLNFKQWNLFEHSLSRSQGSALSLAFFGWSQIQFFWVGYGINFLTTQTLFFKTVKLNLIFDWSSRFYIPRFDFVQWLMVIENLNGYSWTLKPAPNLALLYSIIHDLNTP